MTCTIDCTVVILNVPVSANTYDQEDAHKYVVPGTLEEEDIVEKFPGLVFFTLRTKKEQDL